jgi:plasmid maintenance system killer protein
VNGTASISGTGSQNVECLDLTPIHMTKKLSGYDHLWSVRINEQYRAIGERHGDTMVWVWVGTHN